MGKTWAAVIAEVLLNQARRGDVRAIAELANRIEGKPLQPVELGPGMPDLTQSRRGWKEHGKACVSTVLSNESDEELESNF